MSFTSGIFASHARQVLIEESENQKTNTDQAYESKAEEFLNFCDAIFPSSESAANSRTVTEEKLFGFLYYQSRRPKRKRGKRNVSTSGSFNADEYNEIMGRAAQLTSSPVGYDVINQYYCAILRIWARQKDLGCNNISKDTLRSGRIIKLLDGVKKRKKRYIFNNAFNFFKFF